MPKPQPIVSKTRVGALPLGSPIFAIIIEACNELVQDGYAVDKHPVKSKDHVLYISSQQGDIVAVLCYRFARRLGGCHVSLAYVEHSSRRMGLFKALWLELLRQCKNAAYPTVQAAVAANNAAGIAALYACHCTPQILRCSFAIEG